MALPPRPLEHLSQAWRMASPSRLEIWESIEESDQEEHEPFVLNVEDGTQVEDTSQTQLSQASRGVKPTIVSLVQ